MKEKISQKKIQSALTKYDIELKHFLPGRVRVQVLHWKEREQILQTLLDDIRNDQSIYSVEFTSESGSVLIHYDYEASKLQETQKRWLSVLQKYS